ncbi:phosphotransferase family protein [Rhodovibrionaceae bacterium A322]
MSEAQTPLQRMGFNQDALDGYLRDSLPGLTGPLSVQPISGGQSNPTFFLTFGERRLVLRKQPPGELLPSAHAVDREFRVMKALADTKVPVPEMLLLCEDRDVTGTLFYVMECLEGRVFHDNALPELSPQDRAGCYGAMADTLADLHEVDPAAVGLSDFGKPGSYFSRQIGRWSRQYQESRTRDLPDVELMIDWLPKNQPQEATESSGLIHGDYRLGNLLFHPDKPEILGVLDWELSTLGHPLGDVGYNMMFWRMRPEDYGGINGLDLQQLGIPAEEEYVTRYFERRGKPNSLQPFHLVFALFRFALILEGIAGRAAKGNASADNADQVGQLAASFAKQGADMIRQLD